MSTLSTHAISLNRYSTQYSQAADIQILPLNHSSTLIIQLDFF